MNDSNDFLSTCARLGADPLLVQGAGGNASYKTHDELIVKASGTWLKDSLIQNNFVTLDLNAVLNLIQSGNERLDAAVKPHQTLRPSIETAMHALIPYRYVFHLHPVDIIASVVTVNAKADCSQKLAGLPWAWIPYRRPGAPLAEEIASVLADAASPPKIWLLANHGLIIADDSLEGVQAWLQQVMDLFTIKPIEPDNSKFDSMAVSTHCSTAGYRLCEDACMNQLVRDPAILNMALNHWVLYPDHAIFLGRSAPVFTGDPSKIEAWLTKYQFPPVVLLPEEQTVLLKQDIKQSELLMLVCYCQVLQRSKGARLEGLSSEDVDELLGLESEQFRIAIGK